MIIAGLTGGIGHGKTTFANLLADQCRSACHFESWELVAEVAHALRAENSVHPSPGDTEAINRWLFVLPDIVARYVHVTIEYEAVKITPERLKKNPENFAKLFEYLELIQDQPALATADITVDNKETFRPILQWLGGYLVINVGPGVWYDELIRRITQQPSNGYDLVTVGGVRFPGDAERLRNAGGTILEISRPSLPEQDRHDITERERTKIAADSIIMNDGTLEQLTDCAAVVYEDLRLRQLHPRYSASQA